MCVYENVRSVCALLACVTTKLPFDLELTYIVPAANSAAALAVVGMNEKTVFAETLELLNVVEAAFAVNVISAELFRFPRII